MKTSILFSIASILFYLAALLSFISDNTSTGYIWFALGLVFLCLAQSARKRGGKDKGDKEQK